MNNHVSKIKYAYKHKKIWLLLNLVSLSLLLFGLNKTIHFLKKLVKYVNRKTIYSDPIKEIEMISRPVHVISKYTLLRCKCLEISLTIWFLSLRSGINCDLKIGTRIIKEEFQAHAWVEFKNEIVSEKSNPNYTYKPFKENFSKL